MINIMNPGFLKTLYGFQWARGSTARASVELLDQDTKAVFHCPNRVTDEDLNNIVQALKASSTHFFSFADYNDLNDSHGVLLAQMIEKNESLIVLNLGKFNKLSNETIRGFADAMENNFVLEHLSLTGTFSIYQDTNATERIIRSLVRNRTNRIRVNQARQAVFSNFLHSGDSVGTLNRSKMVVLGGSKSGKTSTVMNLIGRNDLDEAPAANDMATYRVRVTLGKPKDESAEKSVLEANDYNEGRWKKVSGKEEAGVTGFANELAYRFTLQKMKGKKIQTWQKPPRPASGREQVESILRKQDEKIQMIRSGSFTELPVVAENNAAEANRNQTLNEENPRRRPRPRARARRRKPQKRWGVGKGNGGLENATPLPTFEDDAVTFTLFDFGSHPLFASLHSIFISDYSIYLFVFNLTDFIFLQEVHRSEAHFQKLKADALHDLSFWIKSVRLHAPDAPFLLIGTGLDRLEDAKDLDVEESLSGVDVDIRKLLRRHRASIMTMSEDSLKHQPCRNDELDLLFFPIDNGSPESFFHLKRQIENVAREQNYMKQQVPLRWVNALETILDASDEVPLVKFKVVERECAKHGIKQKQELHGLLNLFHNQGIIVKLDGSSVLDQHIVANPRWLVEQIRRILRDGRTNISADLSGKLQNAGLLNELFTFEDSGIVSRDLLEFLWGKEHLDYLLDLMKNGLLLTECDGFYVGIRNSTTSTSSILLDSFIVPNAMKLLPDHLESDFLKIIGPMKSRGYFDFSEQFVPEGLITRMLCLLMKPGFVLNNLHSNFGEIAVSTFDYNPEKDGELISGSVPQLCLFKESSGDLLHFVIFSEEINIVRDHLRSLVSVLAKVNNDLFSSRLGWTTYVKVQDDEFLPLEIAQMQKINMWMGATENNEAYVDLEAFVDV